MTLEGARRGPFPRPDDATGDGLLDEELDALFFVPAGEDFRVLLSSGITLLLLNLETLGFLFRCQSSRHLHTPVRRSGE